MLQQGSGCVLLWQINMFKSTCAQAGYVARCLAAPQRTGLHEELPRDGALHPNYFKSSKACAV